MTKKRKLFIFLSFVENKLMPSCMHFIKLKKFKTITFFTLLTVCLAPINPLWVSEIIKWTVWHFAYFCMFTVKLCVYYRLVGTKMFYTTRTLICNICSMQSQSKLVSTVNIQCYWQTSRHHL